MRHASASVVVILVFAIGVEFFAEDDVAFYGFYESIHGLISF